MKNIQKDFTLIAPEDIFVVLNHPNARFDFPMHYHSDYEINLVMNTYGDRIIGDSIEPFGSLDMIMVGSNLPHSWQGRTVQGNHMITIRFSHKIIDFPLFEKRLFSPIKQMLFESQKGLAYSEETNLLIRDKILQLTQSKGFDTVLVFFSILHILTLSEHRTLVSDQYDSLYNVKQTKSRRIDKVCNFIERNFENNIYLKDVASLVSMSESAFSHFFRKKTNSSFIGYITDLRINKACKLLTETSYSVTEICYASGFNNISNFMRIFKKRKRCTPNEYRMQIQKTLIKY